MKKNLKSIILTLSAVALAATSLTGCGSNADRMTYTEDGKPVVSIMTSAFATESASDDAAINPVMAKIEEKLGVDLRIKWVASSAYNEKATATLGAGTYPLIMKLQERNSSFIANCRSDIFWEIGDKIMDAEKYPNLSKANKDIMANYAVDGKVYGLYLARDLGRNLVMVREDWMKKVGFSDYPKTLEEFGELCKRFSENDPDGNGKKDTYGMVLTSFINPIEIITVWAGAPNKYGINEETGQLEPAYYFDEYLEGLKFIRNLYKNGYMNKNWATMDPERWNEPFLNGEGGIIIDTGSRAKTLDKNIKNLDPNATVSLFGTVAPDANSEKRVLPTEGYSGFFVFPKEAVKTEEELEICLKIMDQMCDPEISDLMQYGMEGMHYDIVDGNYVKRFAEDGSEIHESVHFKDLNQILSYVVEDTNLTIPYTTKVAEQVDIIMEENIPYCIFNPGAPFVSETYALKGTTLDTVMEEANTKFINGVISEEEWLKALEDWKIKGGDQVVKEINEQYQSLQK